MCYTKVDRTSLLGAVTRRTLGRVRQSLKIETLAGASAENELLARFLFNGLLFVQYIPGS